MIDDGNDKSGAPLTLYIPRLHPELARFVPPVGVLFFDPGTTQEVRADAFRPQGLPLNPAQARRTLNGLLQFGAQAEQPGDLAWMGVAEPEGIESRAATALRSEFGDLDRFAKLTSPSKAPFPKASSAPTEPTTEAAMEQTQLKAQTILLLAWNLEEQLLEIQGVNARYQEASAKFSESLGAESAEEEGVFITSETSDRFLENSATPVLPWRAVLESVLVFLPSGARLLCSDKDIHETWCEMGIGFEPAGADVPEGMEEMPGALTAVAPGWRLLGLSMPRPGAPWLETEYRVLFQPQN
jgi:hypothetical protein